jgi:hypothetical protein
VANADFDIIIIRGQSTASLGSHRSGPRPGTRLTKKTTKKQGFITLTSVWPSPHYGRASTHGPQLCQRRHDELPNSQEASRPAAEVHGRVRRRWSHLCNFCFNFQFWKGARGFPDWKYLRNSIKNVFVAANCGLVS